LNGKKSMRRFCALILLSLTASLSGCAETVSGCGWVRSIVPDKGDVLARSTKEQIVAHNRAVAAFCREG